VRPECLSKASILGFLPLKASNDLMAGLEPPLPKISFLNLFPIFFEKIPVSSNKLYASADKTSAHL
jgi:hypothetical protein